MFGIKWFYLVLLGDGFKVFFFWRVLGGLIIVWLVVISVVYKVDLIVLFINLICY